MIRLIQRSQLRPHPRASQTHALAHHPAYEIMIFNSNQLLQKFTLPFPLQSTQFMRKDRLKTLNTRWHGSEENSPTTLCWQLIIEYLRRAKLMTVKCKRVQTFVCLLKSASTEEVRAVRNSLAILRNLGLFGRLDLLDMIMTTPCNYTPYHLDFHRHPG